MDNDESGDREVPAGTDAVDEPPAADGPTAAELDAYDLDGDGKISLIEAERGRLGIVDARLEEIAAEDDGLRSKLAQAAHEVLDRLDND